MIQVDRVSGAGFTMVETFIEGLDDFAGYQLQVQAKNENYIARCFDVSSGKRVEGPVLACTPDLITIIDSESGESGCPCDLELSREHISNALYGLVACMEIAKILGQFKGTVSLYKSRTLLFLKSTIKEVEVMHHTRASG